MVADDYLINYIANGSYGLTYSDRLTFLRMPLGVLLKFLYGLTSSWNWYFLLLLSLTVLSFIVLNITVWKRTGSPFFLLLTGLADYLIVGHFLSFTVVAFLAGAAAFCCFTLAAEDKEHMLRKCLPAVLFLLVSYYLRRDAAAETVIVFLPLFVSVVRRFSFRELRALAVPAALFAALFLVSVLAEKSAYSSPEWQEFRTYDDARSAVVDNYAPDYDQVKKEMKAIGVSRLDSNLLNSWRYCEKDFFDSDLLTEIAAVNRAGTTLEDRMANVRRSFVPQMIPFLIAPLVLFAALLFTGRLRKPVPALITLLIGYGLLFAFAFWRMRFVMRVVMPTQFIVLTALICLSERGKEKADVRIMAADIAALIVLALIAFQYLGYYKAINPADRISCDEEPYRALTEEIASHPDTLYVFDSSALSRQYYYGTPASRVLTTDRFRNITRSGSWDSYSPRYYEQAGSLISDPDNLLTGLVTDDSIVYVSGGGPSEIIAFYKERTGRECTAQEKEFPGSGLSLWTFTDAGPAGQE